MDLYSPVVPILVVAPLDHCGVLLAELNRIGGVIQAFESSDPIRILAKIPASALKTIELWVSKTFGDRASVELQPTGEVAVVADEASSWFQRLMSLGQAQGYLTFAEVNETLPLAVVDPKEIESIIEQLKSSGIRIVRESPTRA